MSSLTKFVIAVTKIVELVVFLHGMNCNPINTTPMMGWTPNLQFERKRIALECHQDSFTFGVINWCGYC